MPSKPCEWTTQKQAFAAFAGFAEKTQSAGHIKPLHWYVACRLVLEGGFNPDHIKPRPPFVIRPTKRHGLHFLQFDPAEARGGVISGKATLGVKLDLAAVDATDCAMDGTVNCAKRDDGRPDFCGTAG